MLELETITDYVLINVREALIGGTICHAKRDGATCPALLMKGGVSAVFDALSVVIGPSTPTLETSHNVDRSLDTLLAKWLEKRCVLGKVF